MISLIFLGLLTLASSRPAWAADQAVTFGSGLLTGILGSSVVAAIITQIVGRVKDREAARQKIMEFLVEKRQALSGRTDLLTTIGFLEREENKEGVTPPFDPIKMRDLPSFLEPIGIYLKYNPSSFREAYQVFAKEVLLCAHSEYLWTSDDYNTSPYWTSFKQFVDDTKHHVPQKKR